MIRDLISSQESRSELATHMIQLDVSLYNDRPYVQGSQIISKLCCLPELNRGLLVQAKFTKLSNHLLEAQLCDVSTTDKSSIGQVLFKREDTTYSFEVFEREAIAPRVTGPESVQLQYIKVDDILTGTCRLSGVSDTKDAINALVHGVKALHQRLPHRAQDIWFTGLRGWLIPTQLENNSDHCELFVQCLRKGTTDMGRQLSLLRASIRFDSMPPIEGLVTFSWRSQESS